MPNKPEMVNKLAERLKKAGLPTTFDKNLTPVNYIVKENGETEVKKNIYVVDPKVKKSLQDLLESDEKAYRAKRWGR